jgi:hypothetical protein
MGEVHSILGSVIEYNQENLTASFQQTNYIKTLGQKWVIEVSKNQIPMEPGLKLPE